ncbi:MAG: ribosome-binding factor A [Minisyncoccia bacterium]
MANGQRQEKVGLQLKEIAANFFERESSGLSLITVTRTDVSPDLKNCTVYISVLPESKEKAALDFARRQMADLRTFVKKQTRTNILPFFTVKLDYGEKNRQTIDAIGFGEKKTQKEMEG